MRVSPVFLAAPLVAIVASAAYPASAQERRVDVPAGTVADTAIALARQTGSSIVVNGSVLAKRKVSRIQGTMSAGEAVRRLTRQANARAVRVGPNAWRLDPLPARPRRDTRPAKAERPTSPPPAPAPPPQAPLPPIVVTASKRELPLKDLPAQVSIIEGEELTLGGVGGTEKITQRVATVASTYLGSGRNKLFIRGIADSSFTGPTQATVGQYLGDIRLSYNAPDPDLRLSDLERVEVLEGPQGTLYGAGSLGGIIRLVPNSPDLGDSFATGALGGALTEHGEGSVDLGVVANFPLATDAAGLRVSLDAASEGGYIDKPFLDRTDVNRTSILSARATLRAQVAPGWTVDLIGLGQSTDARDSQYAARNQPGYDSAARVREGSEADYLHGQLVVGGRLGTIRLRSSTAIAGQTLEERYDASTDMLSDRVFVQDNQTRMIAHETRLWQPVRDRFGWVAGLSLVDNRTELNRSLQSSSLRSATTGVLNTVTEATVYAEGSYRLRDNLTATLGGRYSGVRLGGAGEDVALALAIERAAVTASRNQSAFLPSASLVARLAPDTSFYLRYQEGFRPGGLAIEGNFVRRFERDDAQAFEAGLRHGQPGRDPFDLALNLSYTRWNDIQADFIDTFGLPSTANIGDGRVWTLSASGGVFVTPDLRLTGGLSVNRSTIDEPPLSAILLSGRASHVPNIAEVSGRLGLEYSRPIDPGLDLDARLWGSYVGKSRLGIGPELGDLQGDYLDSGLTVRIGNERLGGTLSITNLADVKGNRFALGTPFAVARAQETPLRPRTIRLGVDFAF
ncbi:TonB-dependent receptor [Alteriqipengyuania lutimaris]|uniref:TonB-dependent receptor n=1 Tax=Alteriqipengyuania lutimaris TaxID=1538146 RepID=A0A395LHA3_9SPHN|nr:TonB-dependent receptor [Alteriqipengyuania lutimaris]MBB3035435.1 outer membrane receptor protein involved in Fe transport [Alteriqipengyuania lutimaris]RDS76009.1 TonB-dependent receptor [Alteriqipengyuania lutimaris]